MGARCLRPDQTGRWRGTRGRLRGRDCRYEPAADLRTCLACGELILVALHHPALAAVDARICPGCRAAAR